jgi:calcineurin-like phosphoesterase family protein
MTAFFTADHHFGHANIIKYCDRPYSKVLDMDNDLIEKWNSVVGGSDVVYYVGDFSLKDLETVRYYFSKLNGRVRVLDGSHDRWISEYSRDRGPGLITKHDKVLTVEIEDKPIILCHYAMRSWDRSHYATWHIFGHHHGKLEPYGLSFDIGVDCWDFYPVSLEQVAEKMATLTPIVDYSKKR